MKIRFALFPLALCAALATPVAAGDAAPTVLGLGTSAPMKTVKMKNVDGRELSIAEVAGANGTLVLFSCNACPWVKAWEKRIVDLGNHYAKRGIGVIVINANDPARNAEDGYDVMQQRAREGGMRFPYVVDATSDVARAFGATRTPEAFLFDAAGELAYHGAVDDNAKEPRKVERRYLRDALQALVESEEVAMKETKALGCSIKFRTKTGS